MQLRAADGRPRTLLRCLGCRTRKTPRRASCLSQTSSTRRRSARSVAIPTRVIVEMRHKKASSARTAKTLLSGEHHRSADGKGGACRLANLARSA